MALGPGSTIGPFKIQSLIGKGGMGEVFSALDTRLNRSVAIKVLPPEFASNKESRARFEREARAISNLTHPHICTLYDIGRENGTDYLVMERLEGQTLAERLRKGPLPLELALEYGVQITSALDRAHRAGIVHRDLKPGNIMLTKTGVKLLDFGLAKFSMGARSTIAPTRSTPAGVEAIPPDPDNAPTFLEETTPGMMLGTVQYMAPEQIEGSTMDHRTDIFALGCVLYEMVTGKRAFDGKSQASVMAAILDREPEPINSSQPLSPRALDHLVKHCLAKSSDERWQTAHDIKLELENIRGALSLESAASSSSKPVLLAILIVGVALGVAGASLVGRSGMKQEKPATPRKFNIRLPTVGRESHASFAISPDGTWLAYIGNNRLYIRKLTEFESAARAVANSEGAMLPFWSPDGESVGFALGKRLFRVGVDDLEPQLIAESHEQITTAGGAAWLNDNRIVFGSGIPTNGLLQVSANGGTVRDFVPLLKDQDLDFHEPRPLPDGKSVVFVVHRLSDAMTRSGTSIAVSSGGTRKLIYTHPEAIRAVVYAPSEHLVFSAMRDNNSASIWAVPFSSAQLEVTGEATLLYAGGSFPSVARDGTLVFLKKEFLKPLRLVKLDESGRRSGGFGHEQFHFNFFNWSPDNQNVLTVVGDPVRSESQLWISGATNSYQLTFSNLFTQTPSWFPDGSNVLFSISGTSAFRPRLQAMRLGTAESLDLGEGVFGQVTSDGKWIVYLWSEDRWLLRTYEIRRRPYPAASADPETLFRTSAFLVMPCLSPDDQFLAYVSNEKEISELYITRFPSFGPRWKVNSPNQAFWPRWRKANGRYFLYFTDLSSSVFEVPIDTTSGIIIGTPVKLFDRNNAQTQGDFFNWPPNFDVSADGRSFLSLESAQGEAYETILHVVENVTAEPALRTERKLK